MTYKLKSRKLWVWIVWTIIAVVALFRNDLPTSTIFEFYGLVSLAYIGVNGFQRWADSRTNNPGGAINNGQKDEQVVDYR
jgi:threonine/homoserine/homoserine lactone efflux protein